MADWAAYTLQGGVRALLDMLYPPTCPLCRSPGVDGPGLLCESCASSVEEEGHTAYCPTCARTTPPFAVSDGRCGHCREQKARIAGVVRIGPYGGELGAALRAFKYQRNWRLGASLGDRLATALQQAPWLEEVEALVVVPQWILRRPFAGDYPPALLGRRASRATGIPVIPALRRVKGGPSQIGLTNHQRVENVRGKFAVARGVRVDGATLCLIDDVMTTGATVNECARILLNAGARAVYAAVAAHVSHDSARGLVFCQP
ncbi:MAG: ComF family protein [bacterium]|nr:ComF family protein [bacterium]